MVVLERNGGHYLVRGMVGTTRLKEGLEPSKQSAHIEKSPRCLLSFRSESSTMGSNHDLFSTASTGGYKGAFQPLLCLSLSAISMSDSASKDGESTCSACLYLVLSSCRLDCESAPHTAALRRRKRDMMKRRACVTLSQARAYRSVSLNASSRTQLSGKKREGERV